jgi:hypothetical protein
VALRRVANSAAGRPKDCHGFDAIGTMAIYFGKGIFIARGGIDAIVAIHLDNPTGFKSGAGKIRARQDCFRACFGII